MNDPAFRYGFMLGLRLGLWCLAGILGSAEMITGGIEGHTAMFVGGLVAAEITIFMLMTGAWLEGLERERS